MGFVYILRSGETDYFKIGRTEGDVASRIKQLSTGNPIPLTLFDLIETEHASKTETFLHNRLQAKRIREADAKEFFIMSAEEIREEIAIARDYAAQDLPRLAEVARLQAEPCDDRWLTATDEARATVEELLTVRAQIAVLTCRKEQLEAEVKLLIGNASGVQGLASWSIVESRRFDAQGFAKDEPELFAKYHVPAAHRSFRLL